MRSDGSQSPQEEVRFTRLRKKTVSTSWTIGRDYAGWMQLVITFPRRVESNRAHFRIECRSTPRDEAVPAGGSEEDSGPQGEAPPRFFIDFRNAYLVFEPAGSTLQIVAGNSALCYGQKWDKVQLKPYLYHLRRNDWSNFFWQVNTSRREAWKVQDGIFCRLETGRSSTRPPRPSGCCTRAAAAWIISKRRNNGRVASSASASGNMPISLD